VSSPPLFAVAGSLLGRPVTADLLDRVCAQLTDRLPVHGIALTLTTSPAARAAAAPAATGGAGTVVVAGASDRTAWWLEMAQLTAGVGPGSQATTSGRTVAVGDFPAAVLYQWPSLGEQLSEAPIGAVAAVPLRAGSRTIGSLDAYRRDRHRWSPAELRDLADAARVLTLSVTAASVRDLNDDSSSDGGPSSGDLLSPGQTAVAQATGMIMAALTLTSDDAVSRLRASAFQQGRLITEVAADITTGRLPPALL